MARACLYCQRGKVHKHVHLQHAATPICSQSSIEPRDGRLQGQFINTAESPSPSFLSDLQTTMTSRLPPRHNSAPGPSTLPEELLLARFVLVRQDSVQPLLSLVYDGPYRVLERTTHFFFLEMGDRTDKVSTLRLKVAQTPADTEPAKPPRRGRPVAQAPPVHAPPPKQQGWPQQVTVSLPPTTPPTTSSSSSTSGRRTVSTSEPAAAEFGGTCGGVLSVPTMFPALTVT
jgi:hypothetical protein